jgi:hypothetical protein
MNKQNKTITNFFIVCFLLFPRAILSTILNIAKICNQSNLHVSSGYPKYKNPKSIQEMGLYNSTMAISEVTVGLDVNNLISSIRSDI